MTTEKIYSHRKFQSFKLGKTLKPLHKLFLHFELNFTHLMKIYNGRVSMHCIALFGNGVNSKFVQCIIGKLHINP